MAECSDFQDKREMMYKQMQDLEESKEEFARDEDLSTYYKLQSTMQKNLIALDKQVQAQR